MESWKVKGVVPDSDEEDDGDTQTLSDEGQMRNASHDFMGDDEHDMGIQEVESEGLEQASLPQLLLENSKVAEMPINVSGRSMPYTSSPSPQVFKHPPGLISSQELPPLRDLQSKDQSRAEEEISRSYITLSSPLSSLPSSPYQGLFLEQMERSNRSSPQHTNTQVGPYTEEMGMGGNSSDSRSMNRRSLRERNPIQLHPYALEGEKYRRTLLARGMRPLRLAQAQDATRMGSRYEASPDPDIISDESQSLVVEDELRSSQSSCHISAPEMRINQATRSDYPDPSIQSDDDEFPEVNNLLIHQSGSRTAIGSNTRMTTYGSRFSSKIRSRLARPKIPPSQMRLNAFDHAARVSSSPPAASSPIRVFRNPGTDEIERSPSFNFMSHSPAPMEDAPFDVHHTTGDSLTPAVHPTKQVIDLTVDDISEIDPFASNTSSEAESSPSEEAQSMQVRRAAKKIRGVLPASWLRLDQQAQNGKDPKTMNGEYRSPSPTNTNLRGVAVRRRATTHIPTGVNAESGSGLLPDDTDSDDDVHIMQDIVDDSIKQHYNRSSSPFDEGFVMEDDHIDAMFSTQNRPTKLVNDTMRRTRRVIASTSLSQRRTEERSYQPKIKSHLRKPRYMELDDTRHVKRRKTMAGDSNRATKSKTSRNKPRSAIPNLSILDVLDRAESQRQYFPRFLRIAARNARSRGSLGRHSPTRKFIRLANKDDTLEAQSTLHRWRAGSIHPRPHTTPQPPSRMPLMEVINESYEGVTAHHINSSAMKSPLFPQPEISRRIANATPTQSKSVPVAAKTRPAKSRSRTSFKKGSKSTISTARPAQLETSLQEYGQRHPNFAFGSSKKTLDTLYKRAHRVSALRGDIQLARFLGQDSRTQEELIGTLVPSHRPDDMLIKHAEQAQRHPRRKQAPNRIDVSAATFRQPSEPLILELLQAKPETHGAFSNPGKLAGLGGFGTTYTHHFDVFPFEEGIFFHESTFIGSGRLRKALEIEPTRHMSTNRGHVNHRIGDQNIRWGPWNAAVSSELGLCVDWIVEQVEVAGVEISSIGAMDIVGCLTFVTEYTHSFLSFRDETEREQCLYRFVEVLENLVEHLKFHAGSLDIQEPKSLQLLIELSASTVILVFQLLRLSPPAAEISRKFERILQNVSAQTAALLLQEDLGAIHKLYDDLQFLSVREGGIKADRYAAQSWVILIQVLDAAQVPRLSFWEVVNTAILAIHDIQSNDAKVLERSWYCMFSLLPLFDFDKTGVIAAHCRRSTLITNWALPQKLLKKVFQLYDTKSRQSPSFSDYLRALFNRCSHLMQAWGWRKHGLIVGTLFDFFARHKLAHLRNEEVYESPRFLGQLSRNPHLEVELSDRCFHILLKIIAISIKQMLASEDMKGIRNIVTRVLPNHDRQYPKEQTIQQKDLASLRNHHDLLCTLFWAAPPHLRPAIVLLRQLIDPATSHTEAYLIHLRAWHNLASFVLASTPTPAMYIPLGTWLSDCFSQLILQYQSTEKDAEQQLRQLSSSARHLVSEQTLLHVVKNNQDHIISCLVRSNVGCRELIQNATSMEAAEIAFLNSTLMNSLSVLISRLTQRRNTPIAFFESTLDIIDAYISKLNETLPPTAHILDDVDEDSQDSDDGLFNVLSSPRFQFIGELGGKILEAVRELLQMALRAHTPCRQLLDMIVTTWASIAGVLIMTGVHTLSQYLSDSGIYNEIGLDDSSSLVRDCHGQFFAILIKNMNWRFRMQEIGRDALSDWLSFLVRPGEWNWCEFPIFEFFAHFDAILGSVTPHLKRQGRGDVKTSDDREIMMLAILREMQIELELQPNNRSRYQSIFDRILATMKRELQDLDPGTFKAKDYAREVKNILRHLSTYFRDLCPIDEFFKANSLFPHDDDPDIFFLTVRSYALRLNTSRGKSEMNHYCFSFAKHAALEGGLESMSQNFIAAMSMDDASHQWTDLVDHFLTVLAPAFSHPAFVSPCGWLLAEPFLTVAKYQLQSVVVYDRAMALRGACTIASTLISGIWLFSSMHDNPPASATWVVPSSTIRTLLLATRFMTGILMWIGCTQDEPSAYREELVDYLTLFNRFAVGTRDYLVSPIRAVVERMRQEKVHPVNDPKLTERLVISYTSFGPAVPAHRAHLVLQDNALRTLAEHCAARRESIAQVMGEIRSYHETPYTEHSQRYIHDRLLFEGLRSAAVYTNEGKRRLKGEAAHKVIPEFSDIILKEMQVYWEEDNKGSNIKVSLGSKNTSRVVPIENCFKVKRYNQLWRELNIFLREYQRVTAPKRQVKRQDRRSARDSLDFDQTLF